MGYKFKFQRPIKSKNIGKVVNHIKEKSEVETMDIQHPFPTVIDHRKLGDLIDFGYMDDAKRIINFYQKEICPLLNLVGLLDDEHVNKYLRRCTSFKDIYDDIINAPGGKMLLKYMEKNSEDFYKPFRSNEYGKVKYVDGQLFYKTNTPEVDAQAEFIAQLKEKKRRAHDENRRYEIEENISKALEALDRLGWQKLPMTPEDDGFKWRRLPQSTGDVVSKIVEGIIYKNGRFSIDRALFEKWSIVEPTDRERELYDAAATICDLLIQIGYDEPLENLLRWDHKGHVYPNMQGILGRPTTSGVMGEFDEKTLLESV